MRDPGRRGPLDVVRFSPLTVRRRGTRSVARGDMRVSPVIRRLVIAVATPRYSKIETAGVSPPAGDRTIRRRRRVLLRVPSGEDG